MMTTPGNTGSSTKIVNPKRSTRPPATLYVECMRPLTGRTLTLRGVKRDGTPYVRTLSNCSIVPKAADGHIVEGMDVGTGRVRCFRLDGVETLTLRSTGHTVPGRQVLELLRAGLAEGPTIHESVLIDESSDVEVAA